MSDPTEKPPVTDMSRLTAALTGAIEALDAIGAVVIYRRRDGKISLAKLTREDDVHLNAMAESINGFLEEQHGPAVESAAGKLNPKGSS